MIWIIGSGFMAEEYLKVLIHLKVEFKIIGRSDKSSKHLLSTYGIEIVTGGIEKYLLTTKEVPQFAIVCSQVESLSEISKKLINRGIKKILVEKPGALSKNELLELKDLASHHESDVFIGYNRRFYSSLLHLKKILKKEVLTSVQFEITEWSHSFDVSLYSEEVKQRWVYANTSHVIDMVINIIGEIDQLSSYHSGCLSWHNSASRFAGSGISKSGILISYMGCWDGPGRWSIDFVTTENRYIFRPLEKIQIQKLGSIEINEIEDIDYSDDTSFKAGLLKQCKNFIYDDGGDLCSLDEQIGLFKVLDKISNY